MGNESRFILPMPMLILELMARFPGGRGTISQSLMSLRDLRSSRTAHFHSTAYGRSIDAA